jgi:hypothetical protein
MTNVIVAKSITRGYGYALQWVGANKPSYIIGPNNTFSWYKYKRDAVKAAQVYNK